MLALAAAAPLAAQTVPAEGRPADLAPIENHPGLSAEGRATSDGVPSFKELFVVLARDLRAIPSRENLTVLGFGAGLAATAAELEDDVGGALSGSASARNALGAGEWIGSALAQTGGAFAAYAAGRLLRSPELGELGADLVRAQLVTQVLTQGIKLAVRRERPDGTSLSFPSGHSGGAFATATVLQNRYGWKLGAPAYGIAAYVAAQRVSADRHYLSDVILGATIGIVSARTVTLGVGGSRFAVTPMAVRGGGGISFVKVPTVTLAFLFPLLADTVPRRSVYDAAGGRR